MPSLFSCGNCQADVNEGSKFCSSCGFEVSWEDLDSNVIGHDRLERVSNTSFYPNSLTIRKDKSIFAESRYRGLLIAGSVLAAIFVLLGLASMINSSSSNSGASSSSSSQVTASSNVPDTTQTVAPDPSTGVDISNLPSGNSGSTAYDNGQSQAQSFIDEGGLTRAIYDQLGGVTPSCKFILDTFMALNGGSSTLQQYADFMYGCSQVVKNWY